MPLVILSFIAGALTIAAPCILPLLPVIVGGSLIDQDRKSKPWVRPVIVAASLAISVILFSLALKATTALLDVPQSVWQIISGIIVGLIGLYYLFPHAWEIFSAKTGFFNKANSLLGKSGTQKGHAGAVLTGASLGPVFNSCSPTYALIVAAILPASFFRGLTYLTAYALGMSTMLLIVTLLGQKFIAKLHWATDEKGWFRKVIGVAFIAVGIALIFGLDRKLQTYILDRGWYAPISTLEEKLGR